MNIIAQACCERTAQEAGGVKVFSLRVEDARKELLNEFQPGRHVAIHYPDISGALQKRFFSITRKQEEDIFEIAVKRSGRNSVSDHMHATLEEGVGEGDHVLLELQDLCGDSLFGVRDRRLGDQRRGQQKQASGHKHWNAVHLVEPHEKEGCP